MDSPRLVTSWRRSPDGPAENTVNLAALAGGGLASDEATEAQPSSPVPADPESTEAMRRAAASAEPAGVQAFPFIRRPLRGAMVQASNQARDQARERTRPIRPRPRSRMSSVQLADGGDSPADLIRLLVPEPDPPMIAVSPGDLLAGRYLVQEEVSDSGVGLVYKALDRRREAAGVSAPWVALKLARPDGSGGARDTADCLRLEFLNLSRLNHPNIVRAFDYANDHRLNFLVLEWLEGETLSALLARIKSRRMAVEKAEAIVRGVARALAHAHERGIVHGDVKPANIFLADDRSVKLLDFGSAGPARPRDEEVTTWATRAYASCEVLDGQAARRRDDVYALGVTAYRMLAGERPYGNLDAREAKARGLAPPRLPADGLAHWAAVRRALALAPAERQQDARQFLRELDAPPETRRAELRQLARIGYGAIAVALLLALVAWSVASLEEPENGVAGLLADGREALAEGRFTGSADSAYRQFSAVLAMEPGNADARAGIREIAEAYLEQARAALAADGTRAALHNLERAREIHPGHYGIVVLEDLIARRGRELAQEARLLAETDLVQAALVLARAEDLLAADDAALAEAREHLARVEARLALEALLARIEQQVLAERLIQPPGDSAVDLLREARLAAPGEPQVALMADRVATALLFQSMFSASSGDIEAAERYLQAARTLEVRHMALVRAQYELAKAKRAQLANRRVAD